MSRPSGTSSACHRALAPSRWPSATASSRAADRPDNPLSIHQRQHASGSIFRYRDCYPFPAGGVGRAAGRIAPGAGVGRGRGQETQTQRQGQEEERREQLPAPTAPVQWRVRGARHLPGWKLLYSSRRVLRSYFSCPMLFWSVRPRLYLQMPIVARNVL